VKGKLYTPAALPIWKEFIVLTGLETWVGSGTNLNALKNGKFISAAGNSIQRQFLKYNLFLFYGKSSLSLGKGWTGIAQTVYSLDGAGIEFR